MTPREKERLDALATYILNTFPKIERYTDLKKFIVVPQRDSLDVKIFRDPIGTYYPPTLSPTLDRNGLVMAYEIEADITIRQEPKTQKHWIILRTGDALKYSAQHILTHPQDFPGMCIHSGKYLVYQVIAGAQASGFSIYRTLPVGIVAYEGMKEKYELTML